MKCNQITIITTVTANNPNAPLLYVCHNFNWETFLSIIPILHRIAQEEDPQDFLTLGSRIVKSWSLMKVATGLDFKLIHYKNNSETSMTQIKYTTSLDVVTCFLYCSCNSVVLRTLWRERSWTPKPFFNCVSTLIAIKLDHRRLVLPLRLTLSLATRRLNGLPSNVNPSFCMDFWLNWISNNYCKSISPIIFSFSSKRAATLYFWSLCIQGWTEDFVIEGA